MASLLNQLSSLRDGRSKNLRKFVSQYKANLEWNNVQVAKAWNSLVSLDSAFEVCDSLFADVSIGLKSLTLKDRKELSVDEETSLHFRSSKDVEFMTSEELSDLHASIRTFIELSVPYFLKQESQLLIAYLIVRYNAAVSFAEYLFTAYIQYHDHNYFCKLLSLLTFSDDSCFKTLHAKIKAASLDFTEAKYVTRKMVFVEAGSSFALYREVTTCYSKLARMCSLKSNVVAFLNLVNSHYIVANTKVMDSNQIRYAATLVKEGMSLVDDLESLSSHMCTLMVIFASIQMTVPLMKELVLCLNPILVKIKNSDKLGIDLAIAFKNALLCLLIMLHNQRQLLSKLPQQTAHLLVEVLKKHRSLTLVFNNIKSLGAFDLSRLSTLLIHSLVGSSISKADQDLSSGNLDNSDFGFFLNLVNTLGDDACRMVVFYVIDEAWKITSHLKSHNESLVSFDRRTMSVGFNENTRFKSHLKLFRDLLQWVRANNPLALEGALADYYEALTESELADHIEVLMYVFSSLSADVSYRLLPLFFRFSPGSECDFVATTLSQPSSLGLLSILHHKKARALMDTTMFESLIAFLTSFYSSDRIHTVDSDRLLRNFVKEAFNDESLGMQLCSHTEFWVSIPVRISLSLLLERMQTTIDFVDSKFEYGSAKGWDALKTDFSSYIDLDSFFKPYYEHLSTQKTHIGLLFELYLLLEDVASRHKAGLSSVVETSAKSYIKFLWHAYVSTAGPKELENFSKGVGRLGWVKALQFDPAHMNYDLIKSLTLYLSRVDGTTAGLQSHSLAPLDNSDDDFRTVLHSVFSLLFAQYQTMEAIVSGAGNLPLLHAQVVAMMQLLNNAVKRGLLSHHNVSFVTDFYAFTFHKFEHKLLGLTPQFDTLSVLARMNFVLNNPVLYSHYKKWLVQNCGSNEDLMRQTFELLRLIKVDVAVGGFSLNFWKVEGNPCFKAVLPHKYRFYFLNYRYQKLYAHSDLRRHFASADLYNGLELEGFNKLKVPLFYSRTEPLLTNVVDLIHTLFKLQGKGDKWPLMFLDLVTNALEFMDENDDLSVKLAALVSELASAARHTECRFQNQYSSFFTPKWPYKSPLPLSMDLKQDLKHFCQALGSLKGGGSASSQSLTSLLGGFFTENRDIFAISVTSMFAAFSKGVFSPACVKLMKSVAANSSFEKGFMFTLMGALVCSVDALLKEVSEKGNELLPDLFFKLTQLSVLVSVFETYDGLKDPRFTNQYTAVCSSLLRMFRDTKNVLETRKGLTEEECELEDDYQGLYGKLADYFNHMLDDFALMALYGLRKGMIWKAHPRVRHHFCTNFIRFCSGTGHEYQKTLISLAFDFKEAGEKQVLGLASLLLNESFNEELVAHMISSVSTLKTYELLLHALHKSRLENQVKLGLMCRVLSSVTLSTDLKNKNAQTFIFKNLYGLIKGYHAFLANSALEMADEKSAKLSRELESALKAINDHGLEDLLSDLCITHISTEHGNSKGSGVKSGVNLEEILGRETLEVEPKHVTDSVHTVKADALEEDELTMLFSLISSLLNALFDKFDRMDVSHLSFPGTFNDFYHKVCTFVNSAIGRFGVGGFKHLNSLVNNLMVTSIKVNLETSKSGLDSVVRRVATSTVNNIIDLSSSGAFQAVAHLLTNTAKAQMDEAVYNAWLSYLLYLYFALSDNRDRLPLDSGRSYDELSVEFKELFEVMDRSSNSLALLSSMVFTSVTMRFKPAESYKLKLGSLSGYESAPFLSPVGNSSRLSDECDLSMYTFMLAYLQGKAVAKLEPDLALFNDRTSNNYARYLEVNELVYALLTSLVFYTHKEFAQPLKTLKSSTSEPIAKLYEGSKIVQLLSSLVVHTYSTNKLGGVNVHIFGVLNTIFEGRLFDVVESLGEDENAWNRLDISDSSFQFYLYLLYGLIRLNNRLDPTPSSQGRSLQVKFEKELSNMHSATARVLFDFFRYLRSVYLQNTSQGLFYQISCYRNDVWLYFANNPQLGCDSFIPVFTDALELLKNKYDDGADLEWAYLDMVYSLKLLIVNGRLFNDSKVSAKELKKGLAKSPEVGKVLKLIDKARSAFESVILANCALPQFVHTMCLVLLVALHKYYGSLLSKDFLEFSLNLLLGYSSTSSGKAETYFDLDDLDSSEAAFDEWSNLRLEECLKAIENPDTLSLKECTLERLMTCVALYTSRNVELKSLVRLFSRLSSSLSDAPTIETFSGTTRLLRLLSASITANRPKSKYLEDLKDVYLISISFYSKHTFESLFVNLDADCFAFYNKSHRGAEEFVGAAKRFSTSMFTVDGSERDSVALLETSMVSYVLTYFSLISSNNLLDILEKQGKMLFPALTQMSGSDLKSLVEADLKARIMLVVTLAALSEYGSLGATNLIITRLYQQIDDVSERVLAEARVNHEAVGSELSFETAWTWFNNGRFVLELVQKSVDTWNFERGTVPDVVVTSWVKTIKSFVSVFDYLPINGDLDLDNITGAWSRSIEMTMSSLVNGFITNDDKMAKIESCLSDKLPTKSLKIKIGCLAIMNRIWDSHGIHLSVSIKNLMPILGELVDDENETVRRLSLELDAKVNEVLYQN